MAKGTTVGYKRLLRFPTIKADQLRIKILESRLNANISQVAAYYAAPIKEGKQEENWNQLPRSGWKVMSTKPLTIDLQKKVTINAFTYAPLNAKAKTTMAFRYKFYISLDGKSWKEVPTNGEFSNIMHNPLPQTVYFNQKFRHALSNWKPPLPLIQPQKLNQMKSGNNSPLILHSSQVLTKSKNQNRKDAIYFDFLHYINLLIIKLTPMKAKKEKLVLMKITDL